ncbi:MAG: DUF2318 domain-containing protein [Chloroflexi bacterium]|nr:DUF2318 domain-containing protein [Chloroflexota bacterium]
MLTAFIITLREGIEAALIVGIVLVYLGKSGRTALRPYVYWGLGAAVAASLALAGVFQAIGIDPENEYVEGTLFGIAGILVATLVIWMWRTARNIRTHMEASLASILSTREARRQGLGLLAFTFFMVFREGVETVLFLLAASLGEPDAASFMGGSLGLAIAVIFAVLFVRGSLRINLGRFFTITSIVLLLLSLRLLAGSVHEFAEVGVLPMRAEVMRWLGYFVRDRSSTLILMAILVLPLLMVLWSAYGPSPTPESEESAAQRRKLLAAARRERVWRLSLVATVAVLLLAMTASALASSDITDPVPEEVAARDGSIVIPLAGLKTGKLHKYVYHDHGVGVRFLVVKLEDGEVMVALDACQICGTVGYMQEGRHAICKNCNAPIPMNTMGLGGGCNPLPLDGVIEGDSVVISATSLLEGWPG